MLVRVRVGMCGCVWAGGCVGVGVRVCVCVLGWRVRAEYFGFGFVNMFDVVITILGQQQHHAV